MIDSISVAQYCGASLARGEGFVYIPPHPLLSPYIANYTLTCPRQNAMPHDYTILPSASATLCFSVNEAGVTCGLRGINTKSSVVGPFAIQNDLLLLIEFHPAGLWPLIRIPQHELVDDSFQFSDIDKRLYRQLLHVLLAANDVGALVHFLNQILLARYSANERYVQLVQAVHSIRRSGGVISARQLAGETHYSERQLNRIFRQQVGMGIKTFSRIVRVNQAVQMLQSGHASMSAIAVAAGFFDQPHFIRDFFTLCNTTPMAYLERMSVFYNDSYKL